MKLLGSIDDALRSRLQWPSESKIPGQHLDNIRTTSGQHFGFGRPTGPNRNAMGATRLPDNIRTTFTYGQFRTTSGQHLLADTFVPDNIRTTSHARVCSLATVTYWRLYDFGMMLVCFKNVLGMILSILEMCYR